MNILSARARLFVIFLVQPSRRAAFFIFFHSLQVCITFIHVLLLSASPLRYVGGADAFSMTVSDLIAISGPHFSITIIHVQPNLNAFQRYRKEPLTLSKEQSVLSRLSFSFFSSVIPSFPYTVVNYHEALLLRLVFCLSARERERERLSPQVICLCGRDRHVIRLLHLAHGKNSCARECAM